MRLRCPSQPVDNYRTTQINTIFIETERLKEYENNPIQYNRLKLHFDPFSRPDGSDTYYELYVLE